MIRLLRSYKIRRSGSRRNAQAPRSPGRGSLFGVALVCAGALLLGSCGGGGGSGGLQVPSSAALLTTTDVQQVIAQAVAEAQAQKVGATIAVVDRVGNVLGIYKMANAPGTFTIDGRRGAGGGLEKANPVGEPAFAAIAKALTATYFSSAGNAFSSRTAGQIIQQNFDPGQTGAAAGPLFGVQFSQLTCSDVSKQATPGSMIGPHRSPLGFAAQPGGLPLYKNGSVVGAIGVMADTVYAVVTDYITGTAPDISELVAVAGTSGFEAPAAIRADRITADGRTLIFTGGEQLKSAPGSASFAALDASVGALFNLPGYGGSPIVAGTAYGDAKSGIAPDTNPALAGTNDYILVDDKGNNRYPPKAGTDGLLTQAEVVQILKSTLQVANHTRAQVRQPLGSVAQVSVTLVDTKGEIVGYVRSPDALVDSVDVVQQKARTAVFFSNPTAAAQLAALPSAKYLNGTTSAIRAYVSASQSFFNNPNVFSDGTAFSTRSIGNISSPFFPDGIPDTPNGPLAKPNADWSIFNNGLAFDLVADKFIAALGGDITPNCTGIPTIRNGITLFGGGFPIYRGTQLVGAIGVSGDGTDQSDLIGFLGINNAGKVLNTGIGNAPASMRADNLTPQGVRLRYVNCPTAPFLDSNIEDACAGL